MILNPPLQGFQTVPGSDARQRQAARNPGTSPAELHRLFAQRLNGNQALCEALAHNPSTPLDLLAQLVEEAPSAFCRNPIAPLVSLEMPNFPEKVSPLGIARMLRLPRAPASLVHQIAEGTGFLGYLTQSARWHIQYRQPIPDTEWTSAVRQFLWDSLRAITDKDQRQAVVELAELGAIPQSMAAIMGEWPTPEPEDFDDLCNGLEPEQAEQVRQGRAHIPEEMFDFYNEDSWYPYLGALFNPDLPQAWLIRWLANIYNFKEALARNTDAPASVLIPLSHDGEIIVRRTTLHNSACPSAAVSVCRRSVFRRILHESWEYFFQHANSSWRYLLPWAFGRIVVMLSAPQAMRRPLFVKYARSPLWEDRLASALAIDDRPNGQPMKPRHRILLEQLANDGNCLVRATAQGRLRGETFSLEE